METSHSASRGMKYSKLMNVAKQISGVLPVENSLAGSVNEVYDLLLKHNLYICKALRLE